MTLRLVLIDFWKTDGFWYSLLRGLQTCPNVQLSGFAKLNHIAWQTGLEEEAGE